MVARAVAHADLDHELQGPRAGVVGVAPGGALQQRQPQAPAQQAAGSGGIHHSHQS